MKRRLLVIVCCAGVAVTLVVGVVAFIQRGRDPVGTSRSGQSLWTRLPANFDTPGLFPSWWWELNRLRDDLLADPTDERNLTTLIAYAEGRRGDAGGASQAGGIAMLGVVGGKHSEALSGRLLPILIPLLNNREEDIRAEAALSLGQLGDSAAPAAEPLVFMMLDNVHNRSGGLAIEALGMIRARADIVVPALTSLVPGRDPVTGEANWARDEVLDALAVFGSDARSAAPRLAIALEDPDPNYRTGAALALSQIDPDHPRLVPYLEESLQTDDAFNRGLLIAILKIAPRVSNDTFRVFCDHAKRERDEALRKKLARYLDARSTVENTPDAAE